MYCKRLTSAASVIVMLCYADEEERCDKDSIAIVTGSLVNDVHTLLTSLTSQDPPEQPPILPITPEAQGAIKNVNLDSFVVVSHSAGAVTAIDMLTGQDFFFSVCMSVCLTLCKSDWLRSMLSNRQQRNCMIHQLYKFEPNRRHTFDESMNA